MVGAGLTWLPLSAAQQGVWFAHQMDASGQKYTCAEYVAIDGPVDVAAFRSAWRSLRAESEVLRVSAVGVPGSAAAQPPELAQLVEPADDSLLPFFDLSGGTDAEQAARAWMRADMLRPTDLQTGPVSGGALLMLSPRRFFFYCRMHHVVIDAYGMHLLQHRLAAIYSALVLRLDLAAPAYGTLAGLVAADVAYRSSPQFAEDRQYWTERFADCPAPVRLPGRPAGQAAGQAGRAGDASRLRRVTPLAGSRFKGLAAAAAVTGTSWQVVLIAAIGAYAYRVTGRRDVILGMPVSGRRGALARQTPGMMTNTVALRLEISPGMSLASLVPVVAGEIRRALRHESYRFEDVCRDVGAMASEGGFLGPLVNIVPLGDELQFGGSPATAHNLASGPTVDLSVSVRGTPGGEAASLMFDANPGLHDMRGLAEHQARLTAFTAAIAADPGRPIGWFDLLRPAERRQLLVAPNATERQVPPASVPALFTAQAARTPDAVAVVSGHGVVTYRELDAWSDRLAADLAGLGAGPEEFVALALPRSPELVAAMLAVLKAGAAYLPVDLSHPAARVAFLIGDSAPKCVLTDNATQPLLPPGTARLLIDGTGGRSGTSTGGGPAAPASSPAPGHEFPRPDSPAYLIYTSGSTGVPKGVVVPHAGLTNLVADHTQRFGISASSRVLQFVSPGFDVAIGDIWPVLLSGGRLVLAPDGSAIDAEDLLRLLIDERITHASIPPVVLAQLPAAELPDLAVLLIGGEPPDAAVVQRWAPGRRMVNIYGVTEASVASTASPPLTGDEVPPIGRPIANSRVYALDESLLPAIPGAAGELYISGAGLARGYLRQPSMTAERFLPCPFGPPGSRMYRTGDLARWRPDGNLLYLGRADDQVKVRGLRIEPGEIEAVLASHDRVDAAVVLVRADQPGRKQLVGYVRLTAGSAVEPAELRQFAARTLPDYMVPAAVIVLDALPITPNGKVDRRALPAPDFTAPAPDRRPRAPGHKVMSELFAEVLGVDLVGADDSFFDRGGDSIMVLQLVSLARQGGLEITSREVFEHPTVAGLASLARPLDDGGAAVEPAGAGIGPVPLTPIAHWLLEQQAPVDGFYQAVRLGVPAQASRDTLARVLQAVTDHHDALRLRLCGAGGRRWALEVMPAGTLAAGDCLTRVDIAGLDESAVNAAVGAQEAAARRRLAPAGGPIMQAVWFDAGRSRAGLLLMMLHHLAVDGVSWRILLPDMAAAWLAISAGQPATLAPVSTSLRTWARYLTTAACDQTRTDELVGWTQILRTPDPVLAGRPVEPGTDTFGGARNIRVTLPAQEAAALLTTVPALFHARVNDVLLTGLALAFAEWRRRRAIWPGCAVLLDLEGHGREEIGPGLRLDRTVGWFTSVYPARLDPGELSWAETCAGGTAVGRALKRVKEQLRAIPDNGIGFGLLRYLNPQTAPRLAALGERQLAFNYLGRFAVASGGDWKLADGEMSLSGEPDPRMPMTHALECNVITYDRAAGPEMDMIVVWAGALLTEAEVRELTGLWRAALGGITAHSQRPRAGGHSPSDLPLVKLSQDQVDTLARLHPDMLDVLPLSPLQQGFLVHHLLTEQTVDVYTAQLRVDIEGPLSPARMRAAVAAVLRRHPHLCVAFRHDDLPEPVQVVCEGAPLPWAEADLSGMDPADCDAAARRLVAAERAHRFDLATPPLLRFLLLKLADGQHRLVMTVHHILWDGWSTSILVRELFTLYTHGADWEKLPGVTPYREYLAWLAAQDRPAARRAWAAALADVTGPTLTAPGPAGRAQMRHDEIRRGLDEELTGILTGRVLAHGLTVNTAVQGAWGLLLSHLTGSDDVIFGSSVSGRPPELPGVEGMVGLFTNTIPVRVRPRADESLIALLSRLQAEQASLIPHHHLGLDDIQRQAGGAPGPSASGPGAGGLFDTTVMFANYPLDTADWAAALGDPLEDLKMASAELADDTHYPLRLLAVPGRRLSFRLGYRADAFGQAAAEKLLDRFFGVLEALAENPDRPVGEIDFMTAEEREKILAEWGGYGQ